MPYETLKESKHRQPEASATSAIIAKEPTITNDWRQRCWRLLADKCCLALVTLAGQEGRCGVGSLPSALSHLNASARLWDLLEVSPGPMKSCAYALAADCYFSAVQQWTDDLAKETTEPSDPALEHLSRLMDCLEADKKKNNKSADASARTASFPIPTNLQEALQYSLDNYRLAVTFLSSGGAGTSKAEAASLAKRLGNVCNEMGVFFMSKAASKSLSFPFLIDSNLNVKNLFPVQNWSKKVAEK